MYLLLKISLEVEEIYFFADFSLELVYLVVHGGFWSLALRILDDEWIFASFSYRDDLPYVKLLGGEDLF